MFSLIVREETRNTKLKAKIEKIIQGLLFPISDFENVSTNGPIKNFNDQGIDAIAVIIAISFTERLRTLTSQLGRSILNLVVFPEESIEHITPFASVNDFLKNKNYSTV